MKIGELASRGGVTAKTVRYYESIGLLPAPERRANGYREYDEAALEQLRFVRDAQASGLTLAEAGGILHMKERGESTCEHSRAALERHLHDIDAQIASLLAAKAELTALARRAESLDPEDCTDPHRCQVLALDLPAEGKV
ncbi:heavy metal-responsive transcriptional regulator [Demequina rhizosphaerae]|uniref:heavy metal-responsive transcriptional regulator n=1 Tax=Demequina rhizosphaerae TaxID=1638985 RepID=UPI000780E378|nr:heavy metal-responsive transcriptional regulator [Demequina rhizosphaerae]